MTVPMLAVLLSVAIIFCGAVFVIWLAAMLSLWLVLLAVAQRAER